MRMVCPKESTSRTYSCLPLQHGFISGRSCVTQLLSVVHDLRSSLDAGDEVDIIHLDFSKAFDSISHGRLLRKFSFFGIQGFLSHGLRTTEVQDRNVLLMVYNRRGYL